MADIPNIPSGCQRMFLLHNNSFVKVCQSSQASNLKQIEDLLTHDITNKNKVFLLLSNKTFSFVRSTSDDPSPLTP